MPSTATTSMPSSSESPSSSYSPTRRRRCRGGLANETRARLGVLWLTVGVLWAPRTRPGPRGGGGGGGAPGATDMMKMVRLGRESGAGRNGGARMRQERRGRDGVAMVRHGRHSDRFFAKQTVVHGRSWHHPRQKRTRLRHAKSRPQPQRSATRTRAPQLGPASRTRRHRDDLQLGQEGM